MVIGSVVDLFLKTLCLLIGFIFLSPLEAATATEVDYLQENIHLGSIETAPNIQAVKNEQNTSQDTCCKSCYDEARYDIRCCGDCITCLFCWPCVLCVSCLGFKTAK